MNCHYVITVGFCLGSWGLPQRISFCSVLKRAGVMGMPFGLALGVSPSLGKPCFIHLGASCVILYPHWIYSLSSRHLIYTSVLSILHKMKC